MPEQSHFSYHIYDEKAMYPLWELQRGNRFSGPDYKQACISINGEMYMGDVELHLSNIDWYHHKHEQNAEYNNVSLHVVSEETHSGILTENKIWVETIHLAISHSKNISCDNIIDACAVSEIESIIKMGAYTRWLQHCGYFDNELDGLQQGEIGRASCRERV